MATLQSSFCSSSRFSSATFRNTRAALHTPKFQKSSSLSVPRQLLVNELNLAATSTDLEHNPKFGNKKKSNRNEPNSDSNLVQELYAVMEIVSDRAEMHKNICAQRDNWNALLLNSVNGMTATAAIMAGFASAAVSGASILPLKPSAGLLYISVTGILLVMNKIQPSQLAEEQRNASRLFKRLHQEIKTTLFLKTPTSNDVKLAMEKVLALDKAYPLPLLGTMIEKFPSHVEPAEWWPEEHETEHEKAGEEEAERNGWDEKLEKEMKSLLGVVRGKDGAEYVRLSNVVLKVNKILAMCGPMLTGFAAAGAGVVGCGGFVGWWGAVLAVVCGGLGLVVNSLEHGGQVGMVFEMYRSSAGFFKLMEETIESALKEGEVGGERENGEVFEVKVALQLGRSISELRDLASSESLASRLKQVKEEFASKLF
ncbi:F-box protein [Pyrus ussuriensis x Pyrus communis]|uniref:F-box protein n=1 Tax=Pyrus ussuriensis x Pyrus communis TaxID=2448454 RepID=A0A5N5FSX1_9ROSA|nr:F-box protein [Pyrus ussuriensis x Pyrus communis]